MPRLYAVEKEFQATNSLSGRAHRFKSGDTFFCDPQTDATVVFEFEKSFFVVDRPTFERCCGLKIQNAAFGL
jgi:hypothetical protein